MTKKELVDVLSNRFYENFSESMANVVVSNNALDQLFELATEPCDLPPNIADKVGFRAAYVFEYIYFNHNELTKPYLEVFIDRFPETKNRSAHRHFTKIMADVINNRTLTEQQHEKVADACVRWVTDPKTMVAVKIWALEILFILKNRVEWLPEVLADLTDYFSRDPSPAMMVRLKRWNNDTKTNTK